MKHAKTKLIRTKYVVEENVTDVKINLNKERKYEKATMCISPRLQRVLFDFINTVPYKNVPHIQLSKSYL